MILGIIIAGWAICVVLAFGWSTTIMMRSYRLKPVDLLIIFITSLFGPFTLMALLVTM